MNNVIRILSDTLKQKDRAIKAWVNACFEAAPPFFYSSVDLRHSGFKIAPVDVNLFPAGFNVLSPAALRRAEQVIRSFIAHRFSGAERVLLIPERHTRNLAYLDNVAVLCDTLMRAGLTVHIGSLDEAAQGVVELESASGAILRVEPICRREAGEGGKAWVETCTGFRPDLVIVNNDMTAGAPEVLRDIAQPVTPPLGMGWYRRRKWVHFAAYEEIAARFATEFGFDPWLVRAEFAQCGRISFKESRGIECVALAVEKVLRRVRAKYAEYGVQEEPYAFVKADSGTYGMGIMTVRSGDELLALNKKARNKMNIIKEGTENSEVIIQEGVPTVDAVDGYPAEPMIYLIDGIPIGGAFRVNAERDRTTNLNAQGMRFTPMCDEDESGPRKAVQVASCNFGVYGMLSQLSAIAASREVYDNYQI